MHRQRFLAGEVIKQSDLKVIPGEGMPQYKNPFEKGNLIIQFVVHFPVPNFLSSKKVCSDLNTGGDGGDITPRRVEIY